MDALLMSEWNLKYNYPICPLSGFKSYDDRMANLKYGFIKVKVEDKFIDAVIISPNGNEQMIEYMHNKLERISNQLSHVDGKGVYLERLKIGAKMSEYWFASGEIFFSQQDENHLFTLPFSKDGILNIQKDYRDIYSKLSI